ncbi:T9SS type A sorting domain-containing protein [bacterium]|nr:T9SS type A sorting domain-containing protein [bacterium]
MNARMMMIAKLTVLAALLGLVNLAKGQPDTLKCRKEIFSLNSGIHEGSKISLSSPTPAFRGTVQIANAPWVKIYFGNCELGQNSYIKMISLDDGGYQRLNAISLKQWQNTSAYFNGDAVDVELPVDPEDKGIFFEVVEVVVGERLGSLSKNGGASQVTSDPCSGPLGICGGFDDRVPTSPLDHAVGRISGIRTSDGLSATVGTGWIASNGAYITAGHVLADVTNYTHSEWLEFNVPASDPDGTPHFAHPNDQYAIDMINAMWEYLYDQYCGRDWGVFHCFPNPNTGLVPVQAQDAFYRLSLDNNPTTFRVTGFGLDECPPGTGTATLRNSSSNTQQTSTGPNYGEVGSGNYVHWNYAVDIRNGNSGSPMIPEGTSLAVGIQTCGSYVCPDLFNPDNNNLATSFDCDALENEVNTFPGANIVYADNGHPFATGSGTVFRPYNTVAGAVAAVPAGGIVSIVRGAYNESITINTAMTIVAPVGNVTIGPTPPPKIAEGGSGTDQKDSPKESTSKEYSLSQNYPNPFNPETTIEYTLPQPSFVILKLFDILAQEVRTLVNEFQQSGTKSAVWDGRNNHGQLVPSGQYFYRLTTDGFTKSYKSLLLR